MISDSKDNVSMDQSLQTYKKYLLCHIFSYKIIYKFKFLEACLSSVIICHLYRYILIKMSTFVYTSSPPYIVYINIRIFHYFEVYQYSIIYI